MLNAGSKRNKLGIASASGRCGESEPDCGTQKQGAETNGPNGDNRNRPKARASSHGWLEVEGRANPISNRIKTLRDFETFLRKECGFAQSEARRIAKYGFEEQSPADENKTLEALLRQNLEKLRGK